MGGSKSGSSTTTVKRLPDYAQPYAKDYMIEAEKLSLVAYTPYAYDTITDQPQDEIDALVAMVARGKDGDPVMNEAVILLELILNGAFLLGTRQAFIDMWSAVQSPLATEINTLKGLIGNDTLYHVGAPISENRVTDELTTYATTIMNRLERKLYRVNYDTEREAQSVATGASPGIGRHGIIDAEVLRAGGLYQREYDQAVLHDLYRKFLEIEEGQIKQLDILGNSIRAMVGTQTSSTKPYYRPDKTAATVGGALTGAALGAKYGSAAGGWGVVIGAVVGGVLGNVSSG